MLAAWLALQVRRMDQRRERTLRQFDCRQQSEIAKRWTAASAVGVAGPSGSKNGPAQQSGSGSPTRSNSLQPASPEWKVTFIRYAVRGP
jgi:hypothetical protein